MSKCSHPQVSSWKFDLFGPTHRQNWQETLTAEEEQNQILRSEIENSSESLIPRKAGLQKQEVEM